MSGLPVIVRGLRESDHNFVIDSWVNTVRFSAPALDWVPGGIIARVYRQMARSIIKARPELFHLVVSEDDEDQIFGWSCADKSATHFVYVKEKFRRLGLAGRLYDSRSVSHWTAICEKISDLHYTPSLFKELIHEVNTALERDASTTHQHAGQVRPDIETRGDRAPANQ